MGEHDISILFAVVVSLGWSVVTHISPWQRALSQDTYGVHRAGRSQDIDLAISEHPHGIEENALPVLHVAYFRCDERLGKSRSEPAYFKGRPLQPERKSPSGSEEQSFRNPKGSLVRSIQLAVSNTIQNHGPNKFPRA